MRIHGRSIQVIHDDQHPVEATRPVDELRH
jgi:hypothetical protein